MYTNNIVNNIVANTSEYPDPSQWNHNIDYCLELLWNPLIESIQYIHTYDTEELQHNPSSESTKIILISGWYLQDLYGLCADRYLETYISLIRWLYLYLWIYLFIRERSVLLFKSSRTSRNCFLFGLIGLLVGLAVAPRWRVLWHHLSLFSSSL